ncbi:hypothetical protein CNR22_24095 [Sphingobacteriaceae bacterium]|nr:hypothetical protein CNR22_24095 [Sphingobacteriaceae bacterium]
MLSEQSASKKENMRLEIEKTTSTQGWSNKDFSPKFLELILKNESERPSEIKIYFADKELIFEKKLFEGLPYLTFKADAKAAFNKFKLMPSIALERRYAFYYLRCNEAELVESIELLHL